MKKLLIIFITLTLMGNIAGCSKENKENKDGQDTKVSNSISAKIAEDIEKLSKEVSSEVYVNWKSGKNYGTHTIDKYVSNNSNNISFNINKDGSIKDVTIYNTNASIDALHSFTPLIICMLNNESLGFTDDDMHEIGYGIAGKDGLPGEKHFFLEKQNFNVSYSNEHSEDLKTRNLLFHISFIK